MAGYLMWESKLNCFQQYSVSSLWVCFEGGISLRRCLKSTPFSTRRVKHRMREYQELLVSSLSGGSRCNFDQPVNRIESQPERSQRAHAQ